MNTFIVLIATFAAAAVMATVLTPLVIFFSHRLGVVDLPGSRKVHKSPIPRAGGVAIAAAVLLAVLIAAMVAHLTGTHWGTGLSLTQILTLLGAGTFILLVGLADDLFNLPGRIKLLAVLAAASAICSSNLLIQSIGFGGGASLPLGWFAWPVTLLWLASVTVSVNFIDGLDGLAAGIVAIAAAALGAAAAARGNVALAALALALAGGLGGFLVFNFNPAKVFMGDSGSMFIGFFLAACGVCGVSDLGTRGSIFLPSLILCVPILDTVLTFVRRGVLQRRSLFSAERGHIHHRLLDLGLCQRHAVLLLYAVTFIAAAVGLLGLFGGRSTLVGGTTVLAVVLVLLFRTAGSVRARETVAAIRRNRAIGREHDRHRRAFEEVQLRFRSVQSFDQWWEYLCAAAETFEFWRMVLTLTNRDGSLRTLTWCRADEVLIGADAEPITAQIPVRQRRAGTSMMVQIRVPTGAALTELAGHRVMLFSRLIEENSLATLSTQALRSRASSPVARRQETADSQAAPVAQEISDPRARSSPPDADPPQDQTDVIGGPTIGLDLGLATELLNKLKRKAHPCEVDLRGRPARAINCRVAVVHDFLYTYGGAERVVEQILAVFPQAEVFSLFDFVPREQRGFLGGRTVRTTFLQRMPRARTRHRLYLPLMPLAIEQLDVAAYDIVISSSYAVAKGVLTRPGQLHISYCHSPVRFAWDLQNQYLAEAGIVAGVKSFAARIILQYIRNFDVRTANAVDAFLTNSRFVSQRVEKFYRRHSTPVYPPVDIEQFTPGGSRDDYYLTASRMVPYKKMDVIIQAFNRMPGRRLVVVGEGPQFNQLKALAGPNVRMAGRVSGEQLKGHLRRARAFVFAAEEDFGIAPVEAQACGTPVIAYGRGGSLETIVEGQTGLFFYEQTAAAVADAVERFESQQWNPQVIRQHAQQFSSERFREQFARCVEREWSAFLTRSTAPQQARLAPAGGESAVVLAPRIADTKDENGADDSGISASDCIDHAPA